MIQMTASDILRRAFFLLVHMYVCEYTDLGMMLMLPIYLLIYLQIEIIHIIHTG